MVNELSDLVLPKTDIPEKAVQLYIDEKPILICRLDLPSHRVFHRNILEEILRDRGIINYKTVNFGTDDEPKIGPACVGDRYRVAGMGSSQNLGKFYSFYGESENYKTLGITGIDLQHLERVQAQNPELTLVKTG